MSTRRNDAPDSSSSSSSSASAGLAGEIVQLGSRLRSLHYQLVSKLAEYDHSGHWATGHFITCAHWAAGALGVSVSTAREWLRVGHAIARLPAVDASFAAGRLGYGQVRTLTRIAIDHPDRQDELVALAEGTTAGGLSTELARWTDRNEPSEVRDRRHRRETALTTRTEPGGMNVMIVRLPPVRFGAVMAALDARVASHHLTDSEHDASTDASSPPTVADGPSRPTLALRRADALVGLLLGQDPSPSKVEAEVIVHVRADGCSLNDGTPVTGTVVERIAPQAFLRAMIHDAESNPINVSGRHRHPTRRQQLVVLERDGYRCVDCGATQHLEIHHEPPFEESRRTVVEELETKASHCHRKRHRGDP